ncbi:hypothetical protein ACIBI9_32115 [Nonomuraea sp. NPDC050451]|uniref:hypothetical protein n=1 Tax=Nonomuraea sp. NPDC050451 TaxID=3364364 RepID=UPI003794517A
MIQLTASSGALTGQGRAEVRRELARAPLRREGAPDTAFFRARAWSYLTGPPAQARTTAEDEVPRMVGGLRAPR